MPVAPRETVLCRYRYDPLDRLVDCAPSAEAGIQRFYCKSRLTTEIQGAVQRSVFQHDHQLLAQLRRENAKVDTTLLATDQQRSVLNVLDANRLHPLAYTPYGHRPAGNGLLSLLGFNGERPDPVTGHYLLGNGYRAFNPVLMRFNSPDSLSPFGRGGLNAYAYCGGDPRNSVDPTGHAPITAITKALAAYRAAKKSVSTTSKTISKPRKAGGNQVASNAASSEKGDRATRKILVERRLRADLKELAETIIKNEAELPAHEKNYSIATHPPTTYEDSLWAYETAKTAYGFEKFPAPDQVHWVQWTPESPTIVDTFHFDASIIHQMYITQRTHSNGRSRNPNAIDRLVILRAIYLEKHAGVKLMTIRQENS
jgi:RHS repeat-associated protein